MPTADEFALQFIYRPAEDNRDLRTFKAIRLRGGKPAEEVYDFSHYTVFRAGETTFKRWNAVDRLWDTAGDVQWFAEWSAKVTLGGSPAVELRDLRKVKKRGSMSRRFATPEGHEYKWKLADDWAGLVCIDRRDAVAAQWDDEGHILRVSNSALPILDRIVVTCMLNLWMRERNDW